MNVIHRSIMIPIEALKPHPDNPRKDVGDVTELAESIKANEIFKNQLDDCPDKVLLTVIADYVEDNRLSVYSWEGYYEKNDGLEQWYDMLKKIGYKMSTDEQQLLDGTHECFKEAEDANTQA